LNPSNFSAIGSFTDDNEFNYRPDYVQINTSGTLPTMTMPDGTVLTGVITPDGTTAVFCFSSINLTNVAIVAEGALPVALLSTGSLSMTTVTVDASSYDGPQTILGNYQTPSSGVGAGGYTNAGRFASVGGPGVGGSGEFYAGGGGGGYGGAGGAGGAATSDFYGSPPGGGLPIVTTTTYAGGSGGGTYGGSGLPLQGGSAGGVPYSQYTDGISGAGGGALQIGASGNVVMNNDQILANGDTSQLTGVGGGSGGEIAITGSDVSIAYTLLSAAGGGGGPGASYYGPNGGTDGYGGYGGGGRIEVDGVSVDFSGTADVGGANPGTFIIDPLTPAAPEPSSLLMLGIAGVIGGGYCWRRRLGHAARC
jgi:hypothetical protein